MENLVDWEAPMTTKTLPRHLELGEKIRRLRKQADLTLEALAQKSGLGLGTLSRIENGKAGSNLSTHLKLCEALGLPLAELYQGVQLPREDAVPLSPTSAEAEIFAYDEKAQAILLAKGVLQKNMLPQLIVLQPGGKTHLERSRPGCEKWLFVLEGELDVQVGEQRYQLRRYGTLYFKASLPHQLKNAGKAIVKCISVTSPVGL